METAATSARAPDLAALPQLLPPLAPHSTPATARPQTGPQAEVQATGAIPQLENPMALPELSDTLNQINQTFDLFEIAAEFSVDEQDHEVRIVLRNTRTGEVIRRIPPDEFAGNFATFKDGMGLLFNKIF
jgi:uncharacterized FlaG/YvyC family protein